MHSQFFKHKIKLLFYIPLYLYSYSVTLPILRILKSSRINSFLYTTTFMLIKYLFINEIRLHYDPKILKPKKCIVMSNHVNLLDGVVLWFSMSILKKKNLIYNSKKSLFIYGSLIHKLNNGTKFVFLERNLAYDYITLVDACDRMNQMSAYTSIIFPEGTLGTHKRSQSINIKRSYNRNLQTPKNVIIPKTKGFSILCEHLNYDAILDCTLKYSIKKLSIWNFIIGKKIDVDVFIDFIPPIDKDNSEKWLINKFFEKDDFLSKQSLDISHYFNIVVKVPNKAKELCGFVFPWLSTKLFEKF